MRRAQKPKLFRPKFVIPLLFFIVAYLVYSLVAPLPRVASTSQKIFRLPPSAFEFDWPENTKAAISIVGSDKILQSPNATPGPSASTIKALLALCVLDKKPLKPGESGPRIAIEQRDVDFFEEHYVQNGSVVPVKVGQSWTQRQLLEALLLRSGNNIADTLVVWAFGSVEKYLDYAKDKATSLGLRYTTVADASGLNPATVSSPSDLVRIGKALRTNQTLRSIVAQSSATLPGLDTVHSTNALLGESGIDGIKTGTSYEGGFNLLFSATLTIKGADAPVAVVGVVMNESTQWDVTTKTLNILEAMPDSFETVTVLRAGTKVTDYSVRWGQSTVASVKQDIRITRWKPDMVVSRAQGQIERDASGAYSQLAAVYSKSSVAATRSELQFSRTLTDPGPWWRLSHPIR